VTWYQTLGENCTTMRSDALISRHTLTPTHPHTHQCSQTVTYASIRSLPHTPGVRFWSLNSTAPDEKRIPNVVM
jgi:hypothetical protein